MVGILWWKSSKKKSYDFNILGMLCKMMTSFANLCLKVILPQNLAPNLIANLEQVRFLSNDFESKRVLSRSRSSIAIKKNKIHSITTQCLVPTCIRQVHRNYNPMDLGKLGKLSKVAGKSAPKENSRKVPWGGTLRRTIAF